MRSFEFEQKKQERLFTQLNPVKSVRRVEWFRLECRRYNVRKIRFCTFAITFRIPSQSKSFYTGYVYTLSQIIRLPKKEESMLNAQLSLIPFPLPRFKVIEGNKFNTPSHLKRLDDPDASKQHALLTAVQGRMMMTSNSIKHILSHSTIIIAN